MVDVKGYDSAAIPASSCVAGIKAVRRKNSCYLSINFSYAQDAIDPHYFLATQPAVSNDCPDV
ncbi:hypothetical protein [Mesorhizobium sp.]|uniref:hypothetical protein n=1 Tax=Mesorhizobium sp. TaxID=1871066 RepID=UPI000FE4B4B2|nr:hypothetical protein [Mesorhizobium sp.]RWQ21723.1 MAG: hypothetical protein EOS19_31170 [Mesorhizobium sp.]